MKTSEFKLSYRNSKANQANTLSSMVADKDADKYGGHSGQNAPGKNQQAGFNTANATAEDVQSKQINVRTLYQLELDGEYVCDAATLEEAISKADAISNAEFARVEISKVEYSKVGIVEPVVIET